MPSLRADAPEFLNIGASTSGASGILGGDARKVPMWTPMEPMDRDAGPTLIPTQLRGDGMPASDVQRVWEDSVQTVTPWPGLQADIRPWIARGLWTAIAPQSMELGLLRGQLNEYLVANTAWAVAIAEHLARLDVEVQSLRHEVHVLVSASTSGASPARPSASGVPPGLTSPSASGAPPGTIEELIRAAQRVAVLRSGASTPVWTPVASRAGSIYGDYGAERARIDFGADFLLLFW